MKSVDEKKFYGMGNDCVFHIVLQESKQTLYELISVLLDIPKNEIKSCRVENPIDFGKALDAKELILDVRLLLNDTTAINVELQMWKQDFWIKRSLLYWSRAYDILHPGEEYSKLMPVVHIGIVNFTLFNDTPEFYSEYRIVNVKTGSPYTDLLRIKVLDLTKTELAGATENEQELVRWARIFNAKSMKELESLCVGKEELQEMMSEIRKLNADEKLRMYMEAREMYEMDRRSEIVYAYQEGEQKGIEQGDSSRYQKDIRILAEKLNISEEEAKKLLEA